MKTRTDINPTRAPSVSATSFQEQGYQQQDLRKTALWSEVDNYLDKLFTPSVDQVSNAADLAASPNGKQIAFTGTIRSSDWRSSLPKTRISMISTSGSENTPEIITSGPSNDRLPKWSPDGKILGFLSDRKDEGNFQLYLLNSEGVGEAKPMPTVKGTVENFHWAPDGKRILVHVAGRDAGKSDADGSGSIGIPKDETPAWMPSVDYGDLSEAWRSLWILDLATEDLKKVNDEGSNPWEAIWLGSNAVVSISSDGPTEDDWYIANVRIKDLDKENAEEKVLYTPKRQVACPAVSPSGHRIAVIEALASDRLLVAGDIVVIDPKTGMSRKAVDLGVDITHIVWRDDKYLSYIGFRGLFTVASQLPASPDHPEWEYEGSSRPGGLLPVVTLLPDNLIAIVRENWTNPPEIAIVECKKFKTRTLHSFSHSGFKALHENLGPVSHFTWNATDSLALHGFLYLPKSPKEKIPLVVNVHGGPTWANQNISAGLGMLTFLNLKGYAVFCPNPRGSVGFGQAFSEAVLGDMGGADSQDILSGIKAVCEKYPNLINSDKIGVMGGSYGGFMASLLPTLSPIFKASVSMAAVTDWHSFHTTTNIPAFDRLFLDDNPYSMKGGRYLERSPVMNAGKYKTAVLQTAGTEDHAVPQSQALQYHRACLEKGVDSAIVVYPGEGHGVSGFPAVIDLYVRATAWFEKYMPV